eukprot:2715494-Ditylum_brightwellii.AAC.1
MTETYVDKKETSNMLQGSINNIQESMTQSSTTQASPTNVIFMTRNIQEDRMSEITPQDGYPRNSIQEEDLIRVNDKNPVMMCMNA